MENKKFFATFEISCNFTKLGEDIYITGNCSDIGNWNSDKSVKLFTNENLFPVWKTPVIELNLKNNTLEYKYLIKSSSNPKGTWENFPENRLIDLKEYNSIISQSGAINVKDYNFGYNKKALIVSSTNKNENPSEEKSNVHEVKIEKLNPALYLSCNDFALPPDRDPITREIKTKFNPEYVMLRLNVKMEHSIEDFIKNIVKLNEDNKTWKEKLQFVFELLKNQKDLNKEDLAIISAYLHFLNSGQIKCKEDGTHFRPNHHASLAFNIFKYLLQNQNDDNAILIRSILKNLPSFADQYQVSVPLTRIRDIAHRGDIPSDLKNEIKHSLQNKLHRSASPEDLMTCEKILNKITAPGASYSQDFVHEFKIFYEELKEFFNALGLEKCLTKLKNLLKDDNKEFIEKINNFLELKTHHINNTNKNKHLHLLIKIINLRNKISEILNHEVFSKEDKCNKTLLQIASISEIELENYSFIILSEFLDKYYNNKSIDMSKEYNDLIEVVIICLESLQISNIKAEECDYIKQDLIFFSNNKKYSHNLFENRIFLLKLKAVLERSLNLCYSVTEEIDRIFNLPSRALGKGLGIDEHAIRVFSESFIRSHTIFQFSKIVGILLNNFRQILNLPPFVTINTGQEYGYFLYLHKLSDFDDKLTQNEKDYILFLKEADGTEELPENIKGVVLSHDLPQLSHLAIRARQGGAVFICVVDDKLFNDYVSKFSGSNIYVNIMVKSDDNIKIEKADEHLVKKSVKNVKLLEDDENVENEDVQENTQENNDYLTTEDSDIDIPVSSCVFKIEKAESCKSGAKCANMKELALYKAQSEYETPDSFCVPYSIYRRYAKNVILEEDYYSIDACPLNELENNSEIFRENFLKKVLKNDQINKELDSIAHEIKEVVTSKDQKQVPLLAIRSSSNLEDLKKSAGAGLFDSYLGIRSDDLEEIKLNIVKVWASLFTYRAILSRRKQNVASCKAQMAVLIQEMINPESCFIIHSVNPISHNLNEVYIEMAIGQGETLASAYQRGSPYRIIFHKDNSTISVLNYASFSFAIEKGKELRRIMYKEELLSCKDDYLNNFAIKLGKIACFLEDNLSGDINSNKIIPQDIEGAVYNNKIYLVQTRPEIIEKNKT